MSKDFIRDDKDLAFVVSQKALIEHALEDLRQEFVGKNPRNFGVYSEGYVDQIAELQQLIDEYMATKNAPSTNAVPAPPPVDAAKEQLH